MPKGIENPRVKECKRDYPINLFEKQEIKSLFRYYAKYGSPVTMRFEDDEKNVMIIKYFQLLDGIGGLNSCAEDGLHVGFIDVDNYFYEKLKENLKRVQEEFDLSTFYILTSSKNNWHCICLDKHTFGFWIDVLKSFDNDATLQYQRFAVNRNRFVLRVSIKRHKTKPEFYKILRRKNNTEKSWGHFYFLKLRYGIRKPKGTDNFTNIQVEKYTTVRK